MKLIKCTLLTLVFLFELPSISSDCGCIAPLGVEDGSIPSDNFIASSTYKNYAPQRGRLNTTSANGGAGGWIPEYLNQSQWIQVDLGDVKSVIGIVTQGLSDGPLWVTLYKVNWRNNDTTFHGVLNENGTEVFKGNTDQNTEVKRMFQSTVYAQFIRICPVEWHINIALRFELLGPCLGPEPTEALGVEDGTIQLTASSEAQPSNAAEQGRLNAVYSLLHKAAWIPAIQEQNQWIEADLGAVKSVLGVVTQGYSQGAWVTSYEVSWKDNTTFQLVENENGTTMFKGNTDETSEVKQLFRSAIYAQFIRINAVAWYTLIALRFELLGPCPDNEMPNVICPDDITNTTDPGKSTSSATWTATVTDNVDSSLSATCSPPSRTPFSVGSTPVTCSAQDTAVNTGSCTFNVEVKDNEIPNVICPVDITNTTDPGKSTLSATWTATFTDNVDSNLSVTCSPASGKSFDTRSTSIVTCSATDNAGNTGSCTFNVTVKDKEIPNVICPYDIIEIAVEGNSTSTATWRDPTVIDNVDSSLSAICSPASGTPFSVGSTTVTCSADDTTGNTGNCTFNVEVKDNEMPNVICPVDITNTTEPGKSKSSTIWTTTVTDNVDSSLSATCSPASGTPFSVGSTKVTCSAEDTAGNTGSCTFNVEVKDNEMPNVICPDDITNTTDPGKSTLSATWTATVTDNVDSSLSVTCSPASGKSFDTSSISVVTCSATDNAGNTGSCTFNVTVKDEEMPNVMCPSSISKITFKGLSTLSAAWNEPTVIDNVDSSLSANCSHASGTSFNAGSTSVTCYATDVAGNTGYCTFNVEVVETLKLITGGFTIVKIGPDIATFTADYDDPTSDAYKELSSFIIQALTGIFGSAPGFFGIQILNFESGSIFVDYGVLLESTGASASYLDLLFGQNINSDGELSDSILDLDPESIQMFHEICPNNYCKNQGTCSMDMDDFESTCTCTEDYKGETCDKKKLAFWIIVVIVLTGVLLIILIISPIWYCVNTFHLHEKHQKYKNRTIEQGSIPSCFTHLAPRNTNNVPQAGGKFKHNGNFVMPFFATGNEREV